MKKKFSFPHLFALIPQFDFFSKQREKTSHQETSNHNHVSKNANDDAQIYADTLNLSRTMWQKLGVSNVPNQIILQTEFHIRRTPNIQFLIANLNAHSHPIEWEMLKNFAAKIQKTNCKNEQEK